MTFTLEKASDWDFHEEITVNSLDELRNIYPCLIIDFNNMSITIYDDYVE